MFFKPTAFILLTTLLLVSNVLGNPIGHEERNTVRDEPLKPQANIATDPCLCTLVQPV